MTKQSNRHFHISMSFKVLTLAATAIGVSINLATYEEKVTSTKPKLLSTAYLDSTRHSSGIQLKNSGSGSASIKWSEFHVDGKPVINRSSDIKRALQLAHADYYINPIQKGMVLEPNSTIWTLQTRGDNTQSKVVQSRDILRRINMQVCYCSSYDQCELTIVGSTIVPKSNTAC